MLVCTGPIPRCIKEGIVKIFSWSALQAKSRRTDEIVLGGENWCIDVAASTFLLYSPLTNDDILIQALK